MNVEVQNNNNCKKHQYKSVDHQHEIVDHQHKSVEKEKPRYKKTTII